MTDIDSTLRQVRAARVQAMTKNEKLSYLHSNGWRSVGNNKWQSRNGIVASFGAAVQAQMLADMDAP